jgi:DNA-binding transcriptional regulator YiaG
MMGNPRVDTTSLLNTVDSVIGFDHKTRFRLLLTASGFSRVELAQRVEVHINTVDRWCNGASAAPGAVIAYLTLYTQVKDLLES